VVSDHRKWRNIATDRLKRQPPDATRTVGRPNAGRCVRRGDGAEMPDRRIVRFGPVAVICRERIGVYGAAP